MKARVRMFAVPYNADRDTSMHLAISHIDRADDDVNWDSHLEGSLVVYTRSGIEEFLKALEGQIAEVKQTLADFDARQIAEPEPETIVDFDTTEAEAPAIAVA